MESPNLSLGQVTPYQRYLRSEHWRLLRGAKIQISPRCEKCSSKEEIEVHHRVYRKSWFDARLADLQTLCHHCHTTLHAISGDNERAKKLRLLEFKQRPQHVPDYVDPNGKAVKSRPIEARPQWNPRHAAKVMG